MYPDDCIQSIIKPDDWWVSNDKKHLCRGALIFAFVPHVDQTPYTLEPVGRNKSNEHGSAKVNIGPLRINQPRNRSHLPVAAMPLYDGELWTAYRAKKRPCLVLATHNTPIDPALTRGTPNRHTAQTILIAPYYGSDKNGKRAGYREDFIERIRHCEYPQFVWDKLPFRGATESILRLDHLQPIGAHHNSYEIIEHMLSDGAMQIMDELLTCLIWGGVPEDGLLTLFRDEIESNFKQE